MDCNCININANGEGQLPEIRHVYGNVLRLGIPLTLRTIEMVNGKPKATDSDFIPSSNYPVNVIFSKAAVQITQISIEATMRDDNVACIEDRGTIPVGTYDITVACNDDSGNPYRFKQLASLKVVDTTAEAGIEKGIEYEVETWYLRAAIFLVLKGDAGETVQAQSDWEETDIGNPAFIKNKPTIPDVSNFATKSEVQGKADASDVYTKAEVDSALDLKEDAIDDLSAIRSGAAAGATAVQQDLLADVAISGDYADLDNKPTLFSGNYNDLTNKPTIPAEQVIIGKLDSGSFYQGTYLVQLSSWQFGQEPINGDTKKIYVDVIENLIYRYENNAFVALCDLSQFLGSVAFTNSYNDLDNKPTIPDELADLASDSSHRTVTDTEKSSWNGKADAISVVNVSTTGSVSQTIDPNKFYKFGSIDSLALSLTAGTGFIVYAGKFTASANWGGTKLSVPANVTEASGNDTVEAGKMYEFSIMDDIIIVKEVG